MTIKVIDEGKEVTIKSKRVIKILGVFIDSRLDWTKQINSVKRNATNIIRNLHRVKHILPVTEKIKLYNALVTPHFSYADVVWSGCGKVNTRRLQSAQNFAIRSIVNKKKCESVSINLKEMKLLNLQEKRQVHEAVFIKKALGNKLSQNITAQYLEYIPTSNTRFAQAGKLSIPKHKTSKFESSPLYRTIKIWNSIPPKISKEEPPIFKNQYQAHLINLSQNRT